MASKKPRQAAAVCYKLVDQKPEFLLVQARSNKTRWVFPKGKIKKGEKPWMAAAREAREEAGVEGKIKDKDKALARFRLYGSEIDAYLLEVRKEGDSQEADRDRGWFRRHKAIRKLSENRGGKSILRLTGVLNAAWNAVSPSGRNRIVLSYSRKDDKWRKKLLVVLKPLVDSSKMTVWDDTQIKPGAEWEKEIRKDMAAAKIALLLVSPDFLASDFITKHELPLLRRAARKKTLRIMWIALRPSAYQQAQLSRYQAVNNPQKPLALYEGGKLDRELEKRRQNIEDALDNE